MIKQIQANARISFKQPTSQGDVFYTFEYGEVRENNFETAEQYEAEKAKLWEQVNNEVGKQVIETQKLYKRKEQ